ncbi:helix-turn-helix transcriptional regulator [Cohnella thailandensis]|uniref:AraC family transcriptional regulator n=1 Tax=Cohnella thailandensis TaxID=557557 RepID=A0A841SXD2_9BACL|nr:AraC family transcriptional regulator [Cohnella thailandensis]MBB6634277.1 AraC family transcriptional regulator [Cohnella thailandensis]MBP1972225.1 AraC-like DNA-binding protein [Cohnella thailandensis]
MTHHRSPDIPREKTNLDKRFPIFIEDTIGVDSGYQKLHWHDALEINLIKSGTGYYIINGETFEFRQGDILLINSNDLHCAYETSDLVLQVISFDGSWLTGTLRYDPEILSPFKEMGVSFTNLLDREHPRIGKLRSLLLEMQQEHAGALRSHTSLVFACLHQFLAYVNRDFRFSAADGASRSQVNAAQLDKVRLVIHAMESDLVYPWTLNELSELVFLSPSRFCDIFRRTVGVPPQLYLIQLRLEKAVKLLGTTDLKIVDVAMECGFRNLSNFNRLFNRHFGYAPRTVRQRSS